MKNNKITCQYCNKEPELVTGKIIYPHRDDLSAKLFYFCIDCNAYVGCHESGKPLGSLANLELRNLRKKCHWFFDKTWRGTGISRNMAYKNLAGKMNMPVEDCHIAMFDIGQCQDLLALFKG